MVILWHNLGNSQVSVYRTIGPTLVFIQFDVPLKIISLISRRDESATSGAQFVPIGIPTIMRVSMGVPLKSVISKFLAKNQ